VASVSVSVFQSVFYKLKLIPKPSHRLILLVFLFKLAILHIIKTLHPNSCHTSLQ